MKHISMNFLQNSFIDMIRKMQIRYVKKYINPCVETQKSKEFFFILRISSKTIFSRISSRLEKSGGKSSNFVRTSREQSVSKVRFASSSHGFLSPPLPFLLLFPSFSLFFLFFSSHEHLLHATSWAWNRFRCARYPATRKGGHPAIFHRRVFTPFHRG